MTPEEKKVKRRAYQKAYNEVHKEQRRAYQEAHKEERATYGKAYYESHKKRLNAYSKAYRAAHKEELKVKKAAYYKIHQETAKVRCKVYHETHKAERRIRALQYAFGLSLGDYSILGCRANWRCEICGKEEPPIIGLRWRSEKLHIDHCHATGKVRGLLCPNCNKMLGYAFDNLDILRNAIAYLQKPTIEFNWPDNPDVDWDALCK